MKKISDNYFLIDKPAGWTSFDAVNVIRKKAQGAYPNIKNLRVGHAGTLDPFATGLLIIGVGREATKKLDEFKGMPKTYLAVIRLGSVSSTDDKDGEITNTGFETSIPDKPGIVQIKKVIKNFLGEQEQIPPMYSAKKINGKKLYELARQGKTIHREPNKINIHSIDLIDYEWPNLVIKIECSTGTYIRTLARDIGDSLGTGAYCHELRRTKIGDYSVENAIFPNDFHI